MPDWSRRRALGALGAAGAGALVAPALASCGGQEEPVTSGGVSLDLWTHDPSYATTFAKAAKRNDIVGSSPFRYSITPTQADGPDLVTRMINQAVASGSTPDLIGLRIDVFPRLMGSRIAQHLLVDLTDTIGPHRDDILRTAPYTVDGRPYGLESDNSITVFYYRQDEFEKHGIPTDLDTWEDVARQGARLHNRTGKSLGMVATGENYYIFEQFLQLLLQRGGAPFDADGELRIDSPEAAEVLEFMASGVRSGFLVPLADPYGAAAAAALKSGRLVACAMPSWYKVYGLEANAAEQKGRWRMRQLPRFTGGGRAASTLGGTGFGVLKDKPTTRAATELLRRVYLSREGQMLRFESGGYLPSLRSLYTDPAFLDISDPFLGGQKLFEVYGEAVRDLPTFHQAPEMQILVTAAAGPILRTIKGELRPAAALREIVDAYRGQVKR